MVEGVYVPERRFSPAGAAAAIAGAAAAGMILGLVYGAVQVIMPILYLCALITVLYSTVLGHLAFFFARLGHVRSAAVATVVAMAGGLSGLYGAWVSDRFVRLKLAHVEGVGVSFSPADLAKYIEYFLDNGFWSFGHGQMIFGLPLLLVWAAEAGLMFALAVKAVRAKVASTGYCEPCRRWTKTSRGVRHLVPNASYSLGQELKKGNIQAIHQVAPTSEGAPLALRVDLDQCGACGTSAFVSVVVVAGGTKFRRFIWPEEKALVRHLPITPEDAAALRAPQRLAQIAAPGAPKGPKKPPPPAQGSAGPSRP